MSRVASQRGILRLAHIVGLVTAIAALALPAASPGGTATNFRFDTTVHGVALFHAGCAPYFTGVERTGVQAPHVGAASVVLDSYYCYSFGPPPPTTTYAWAVTLTSKQGDQLVFGIVGGDLDPASTDTWSVLRGTGRFARFSGSGTFTQAWTFTGYENDGEGYDVHVSLQGNLTPSP
jgi:hypothetical protein